jgi:hypothetical protein
MNKLFFYKQFKMNSKAKTEQRTPSEAALNANSASFDFDVWAREVRSQLLASLRKRAVREQDDR